MICTAFCPFVFRFLARRPGGLTKILIFQNMASPIFIHLLLFASHQCAGWLIIIPHYLFVSHFKHYTYIRAHTRGGGGGTRLQMSECQIRRIAQFIQAVEAVSAHHEYHQPYLPQVWLSLRVVARRLPIFVAYVGITPSL